jgi:hypothetical protein
VLTAAAALLLLLQLLDFSGLRACACACALSAALLPALAAF